MYVIGIDGGGTKTTGVIATPDGKVVKQATVGGTNLNSTEKVVVKNEVARLFELLKSESAHFSQVKTVFAGMSGAGHVDTQLELRKIITSLLPHTVDVTVDNDAITALYSGTLGHPGIVQIAGTGSMAYGMNHLGKRERVGGWGHLWSDDGSGYAIGRDGLRAAFLSHDGLRENTLITNLLKNHFRVDALPEIIPMIYQAKNPKETIASLSMLVFEAADHGDMIAKEIIQENGKWLGVSISALHKELFTGEKGCIPVVLVGGLFNRLDIFKDHIEGAINQKGINVEFIVPQITPVGGAVIAALKEENRQIDQQFVKEFVGSVQNNKK